MRKRFSANAAALLGLLVGCRTSLGADRESGCWRGDYPVTLAALSYEKAFASDTLAPGSLVVKGRLVNTGGSEKAIATILGARPDSSSEWVSRTSDQQCEYLVGLLGEHPNPMHFYKLGDLNDRKMSGQFRVSEWKLEGVGTLRAYFHKASDSSPEQSYLYHLALVRVGSDEVHRKQGGGYVLFRNGPPRIEWDVDRNRIVIGSEARR
jgi:hypothetical protein